MMMMIVHLWVFKMQNAKKKKKRKKIRILGFKMGCFLQVFELSIQVYFHSILQPKARFHEVTHVYVHILYLKVNSVFRKSCIKNESVTEKR